MSRLFLYDCRPYKMPPKDLKSQQNKALEFTKILMDKHPEITEFVPLFEDVFAESAYEFRHRSNGRTLHSLIEEGDHLCCVSAARMYTDPQDFAWQIKKWHFSGVTIHFCDTGISSNTVEGQVFLKSLVSVAENVTLLSKDKRAYRRDNAYISKDTLPKPIKRKKPPAKRPRPVSCHPEPWIVTSATINKTGSSYTKLNMTYIRYMRYLCLCRRRSYWQTGTPLSWTRCCAELEIARLARGELEYFRQETERDFTVQRIVRDIRVVYRRRIMELNERWSVRAIYEGINPFTMEVTIAPDASFAAYVCGGQRIKKQPPWSKNHACCVQCGLSKHPHHSRGYCINCLREQKKALEGKKDGLKERCEARTEPKAIKEAPTLEASIAPQEACLS